MLLGFYKREKFWRVFTSFSVLICLSLTQPSHGQSNNREIGPTSEPLGTLNMQTWGVPVKLEDSSRTIILEATTFRPDAAAPFPLVIINHGANKTAPSDGPWNYRPDNAIRWFLSKGYAVAVLIRRGYGRSEGKRTALEASTWPDMKKSLDERANDINSTVEYFRSQPFVIDDRIVLTGISAGGNAVLAAASKNPEGVKGVIAFAPGVANNNRYELVQPDLVEQGFKKLGSTNKIPVLWVYVENDQYESPKLARFYFKAYKSESDAGQELVIYPPSGEDGHDLFQRDDGSETWGPHAKRFLERVMQ
ncbi:Dienelactone hydrolase [Pseudovibrio sp. Tun.PSC04-5.I4]|nr:Dienelactone hydrolase [Pseudovibrio sp. Tun.PSC04-5.I4]